MPSLEINGREYSPELILFDVDGTLIDDSHRYSDLGKIRYKVFKEQVSQPTAETWAKLTGVQPKDWSIDLKGPISKAPRRDDLAIAGAALYLDGYTWIDARRKAEDLYEMADTVFGETYSPILFEGIKDKLLELVENGFMLGIATNGVTRITEALLSGLGLRSLFKVIIGADRVENAKPAPDMIILGAQEADTSVEEVLFVGDQPSDIEAGNRAGVLASISVRNKVDGASGYSASISGFRVRNT